MFLGRYRHNIDKKGRLTVPSRFREKLAEGAFIFQGFDENLLVMTPDSFDSVIAKLNHLSFTDPTTRDLGRLVFSTAADIELDTNGRILIPPYLREKLGLKGETVLVGSGTYFEIWPAEPWDIKAETLENPLANASRFAALDISLGDL